MFLKFQISFLILIIASICFGQSLQEENVVFSREYTAVIFDPVIGEEDRDSPNAYYDIQGIIPMVEKVHTKFDRIMVALTINLEKHSFSKTWVPSAVAMFNKIQTLKQRMTRPLQVWLCDDIDEVIKQDVNFTLRMEKILALADEANTIFPNTVSVIVFDYYWQDQVNDDVISSHISEAKRVFKDDNAAFTYRIGVGLSINAPKSRKADVDYSSTNLSRIFTDADMAVFSMFPVGSYIEYVSHGDHIHYFLQKFRDAKKWVERSMLPNQIPIAFKTGWPDTNNAGVTSYLNLVQFWKGISAWAQAEKTHVILHNAFDTPYSGQPFFRTQGWWRLVPSSTYETSADYIFEDKVHLVKNGDDGTPVSSRENFTLLHPNRNVTFPGDHVMVQFTAFETKAINYKKDAYGISSLVNLIRLVSIKFNKITMDRVDSVGVDTSLSLVPSAVAKVNSEITRHWPGRKPIELGIVFAGKSVQEGIRSFEITRDIAAEANKKFPGTVKNLILDTTSEGQSETAMQSSLLRYIKFMSSEFELGVLLTLSTSCPRNKFGARIAPLLPPEAGLDLILLSYHVTQRIKLGLDRVVPVVITQFETCKRKIQAIAPTIKVILYTSWPDTDDNDKENFAQLVNYWEVMGEWAVNANTTVMLYNAFDTETQSEETFRTCGWWKFVKNDTYKVVADFKFEEKKAVALRLMQSDTGNLTTQKENRSSKEGSSSATLRIIIIAVVLCVIVLVAAVSYQLWYRRRRQQFLTNQEMDYFFKGGAPGVESYDDRPYDKGNYEVDKGSFNVQMQRILGTGEYGVVCCGSIKIKDFDGTDKDKDEVNVAVKMCRTASNTALKGLLSEIKILSYLGKHENVVSLVGAYTVSVFKGKLFVFVELCELGSLQKYLRNNDTQYQVDQRSALNTQADLDRWSREIGNGMEFLAEKKVVHADLATRNILLTFDRTAKISDFGLSRRLYNYSEYVKKQQEPLPWRWMAPEALRRLEFNEKTDVYAYGVTLWEIYSLGDLPHPGATWEPELAARLERGELCLDRPQFCPSSMYSIMRKCWATNPALRPTFAQINFELKGYE